MHSLALACATTLKVRTEEWGLFHGFGHRTSSGDLAVKLSGEASRFSNDR